MCRVAETHFFNSMRNKPFYFEKLHLVEKWKTDIGENKYFE